MTAADQRRKRDAEDAAAVIAVIAALSIAEQSHMTSPSAPRHLWGRQTAPGTWSVGPHQWWASGLAHSRQSRSGLDQ